MRSYWMILVGIFAVPLLAVPMAGADDESVQEQLRLMQQRMAEMEDRLQATSDELRDARAAVDRQQASRSRIEPEAGEEGDDRGARSGVGRFVEMVDVSGVFAGSFNYRFLDTGDRNLDVFGSFRHPNGNTFQLDQAWVTLDKTPTAESRGGFHADFIWGETAEVQGGDRDSGLIYTAYASWLAPLGNGVQIDAGRLPKILGAESMQTNQNFNISQGLLFQLQPNNTTGVLFSSEVAPGVALVGGIVNDVFTATNVDASRNKAYYGKVAVTQDHFGFDVGAIWGKDDRLAFCDSGDDCFTSVFDVVARAYPHDAVDLWIDFTWVRTHGDDTPDGDVHAIAGAGRVALTESTGVATRVEYLRADRSFVGARDMGAFTGPAALGQPLGPAGVVTAANGAADDFTEIVSVTATVDQEVVRGLKIRGEVRWDRILSDNDLFANGSRQGTLNDNRDDQLVGLVEMFYEF